MQMERKDRIGVWLWSLVWFSNECAHDETMDKLLPFRRVFKILEKDTTIRNYKRNASPKQQNVLCVTQMAGLKQVKF